MAFVTEAALIALREGLEALLITGILLGLVTRMGRPDARKHVWLGFGAALGVSVVSGWAIQHYLLARFQQEGWAAWFELTAAVLAVATLTYMVFWMWSHTTQVLAKAKENVREALTAGSLATIVAITFLSVVREGLETVLFYATLASEHGFADLLLSGAIGFAASAGLVWAVLRASRHVNLKRFFQVTGAFLLVVAAMLLTHAVEALTELGMLAPQAALWDTSALVAADSLLGRILHALVGYTPAPTLYQLLAYVGYLTAAGGVFLYQQGFFHASTHQGARARSGRILAVGAVALLAFSLIAVAAQDPVEDRGLGEHGHDHGAGATHASDGEDPTAGAISENLTVGIMLRAHGEPLEYNATTYESFAHFTRSLLETLGYEALLEADQGTMLLDKERPYDHEPRADPDLIDAWLQPHQGPAVYVGSPAPDVEQLPVVDGTYVAPGGPGLGEPDILEAAGLGIWTDYMQMENDSRMHLSKQNVLDRIEQLLVQRFPDRVVVERAHHIRPMVNPVEESLASSAGKLVDAEVDVIVDAYTSHLHSDIMNGCMKKPAFRQVLDEHGYEGRILEAGPSGLTDTFAQGMADAIAEKARAYANEKQGGLWLSLTHHGADTEAQSPCKDRAEPYVAQTQQMFANTKQALANRSLPENTTIAMVYGTGAEDDSEIYSPQQAVDNASKANASHLLDVPYELPGDGYDNLVNHRASYGLDPRQAPHYDEDYETHLTRQNVQIKITSSAFAAETRALAQYEAILEAMEPVLETDS